MVRQIVADTLELAALGSALLLIALVAAGAA